MVTYTSGENEAHIITISNVKMEPPNPESNHSAVNMSGNMFNNKGKTCLYAQFAKMPPTNPSTAKTAKTVHLPAIGIQPY